MSFHLPVLGIKISTKVLEDILCCIKYLVYMMYLLRHFIETEGDAYIDLFLEFWEDCGLQMNLDSVISWNLHWNVREYLPAGKKENQSFKEDHNLTSPWSLEVIHFFFFFTEFAAGFLLSNCFQ